MSLFNRRFTPAYDILQAKKRAGAPSFAELDNSRLLPKNGTAGQVPVVQANGSISLGQAPKGMSASEKYNFIQLFLRQSQDDFDAARETLNYKGGVFDSILSDSSFDAITKASGLQKQTPIIYPTMHDAQHAQTTGFTVDFSAHYAGNVVSIMDMRFSDNGLHFYVYYLSGVASNYSERILHLSVNTAYDFDNGYTFIEDFILNSGLASYPNKRALYVYNQGLITFTAGTHTTVGYYHLYNFGDASAYQLSDITYQNQRATTGIPGDGWSTHPGVMGFSEDGMYAFEFSSSSFGVVRLNTLSSAYNIFSVVGERTLPSGSIYADFDNARRISGIYEVDDTWAVIAAQRHYYIWWEATASPQGQPIVKSYSNGIYNRVNSIDNQAELVYAHSSLNYMYQKGGLHGQLIKVRTKPNVPSTSLGFTGVDYLKNSLAVDAANNTLGLSKSATTIAGTDILYLEGDTTVLNSRWHNLSSNVSQKRGCFTNNGLIYIDINNSSQFGFMVTTEPYTLTNPNTLSLFYTSNMGTIYSIWLSPDEKWVFFSAKNGSEISLRKLPIIINHLTQSVIYDSSRSNNMGSILVTNNAGSDDLFAFNSDATKLYVAPRSVSWHAALLKQYSLAKGYDSLAADITLDKQVYLPYYAVASAYLSVINDNILIAGRYVYHLEDSNDIHSMKLAYMLHGKGLNPVENRIKFDVRGIVTDYQSTRNFVWAKKGTTYNGSGTATKNIDLSNDLLGTPKTLIVAAETVTPVNTSVLVTITDGINSVTIQQSEFDTVVNCSALQSTQLSVLWTLQSTDNTVTPTLNNYGIYFSE